MNEVSNISGGGRAAIALRGVSKFYCLYDKPADRLKQAVWGYRRRYYREFWALRDVSLEVRRGETLAIIGRNGSGKSTLLQIVCGTLAATSGEVETHGALSALLELGAGFNMEFTGRENVFLSASLLGLSRERTRAILPAILEFAAIGDFIDQPVKTYSSGMFVRLAFAVAIAVKPDILVVDEALSVGDIFFQQKCIRHMRENLAGAAKLLVTHDLGAAAALADRVAVLEAGRIAFVGAPRDAIERYTMSLHNDLFRLEAVESGQQAAASANGVMDAAWQAAPEQALSGAGEARIERWALLDAAGRPCAVAQPGDRISVHMQIHASRPMPQTLFGYAVNDRLGQAIFGENTCSVPGGVVALPREGRYVVRFDFRWPEAQPGEYTVTLGIGEGSNPLGHVIQCWAHNVASLRAVSPLKPVHCLFNNPLTDFSIRPLE
ncbi:MAG: Teichoic acids export ATP-binding protein TagH [candidate division BRC1 bacterium ADurb.BinA364]|nr:MAG: Teichoic acids export ATP-binding protein TagH [candidate division BRC1 bacterium ADurb.BinA364]